MDTEKNEKIENETDKTEEEYRFYTVEKEKIYDIKINEENLTDLQREIYKKYNRIKTNDESWNIELLNISEKERDRDSYKRWFYDPNFDVD
jgi:hypothetical protein